MLTSEYCLVGFVMCDVAPPTHKFASKVYSPQDPKSFIKAVRKEVLNTRIFRFLKLSSAFTFQY